MRNFLTCLVLLIVCFLLSGCPKSYTMKTPFQPRDFTLYNQKGTGTLTGQALLKNGDGSSSYYAGQKIILLESNGYTNEIFNASNKGYQITKISMFSALKDFSWVTVSDKEGRFAFSDLPDGTYWVFTKVTKEVNQFITNERSMHQKVTIVQDEPVEVILQ